MSDVRTVRDLLWIFMDVLNTLGEGYVRSAFTGGQGDVSAFRGVPLDAPLIGPAHAAAVLTVTVEELVAIGIDGCDGFPNAFPDDEREALTAFLTAALARIAITIPEGYGRVRWQIRGTGESRKKQRRLDCSGGYVPCDGQRVAFLGKSAHSGEEKPEDAPPHPHRRHESHDAEAS